jgi:hypothetical protein
VRCRRVRAGSSPAGRAPIAAGGRLSPATPGSSSARGHDDQPWQPLARSRELAGRLHNLLADPDGGFWLATSTGLAHHVPTLWSTPRELASFTRPASTIFQARNGDLFVQHDTELLRRHDGHWQAFQLPLGHEIGLVRTDAMAELPDGRILLGGRPTPAMFFDPGRGTFSPVVHPRGWFVEVLNGARGGGAWVLTTESESQRRHLERFDGRTFEDVATGSDRWRTLPPRAVIDLADGGWIVVPDGDGYGEGRGRTLRTLAAAEGVPVSPIAALEMSPGRLWFGSRNDLFERDGTGWQLLRSGLQSVRSIVRGRDGTVWVGSASGVYRFRDGVWLGSEAAEGLPDGAVFDVFEDRDGTVWASTLVGIARLQPATDRDPPQTWVDEANPREAPPSGDLRLTFRGMDRWQMSPAGRLLYSWRTDRGPWSAFAPVAMASLTGPGPRPARPRRAGHGPRRQRRSDAGDVQLHRAHALVSRAGLPRGRPGQPRHHRRADRDGRVPPPAPGAAGRGAHRRARRRQRPAARADRTPARVEEERARLEAQLNQSQKLEAIGRLAGGVAHDFNNLLSVIGSYSELMLDELPSDAALRMPAAEIAKASDRAAALTRQLLAFSRHQVVDAHPLDLNEVVADVERMLRRLIGENIDLAVLPAAGPAACAGRSRADRAGALQPGGQRPRRDAARRHADHPHRQRDLDAELRPASTSARRQARTSCSGVADTGCRHGRGPGEPRLRAVLHDRRASAWARVLGLATVYGIVKRAGGFIHVESAPDRGTPSASTCRGPSWPRPRQCRPCWCRGRSATSAS